LREEGRVAVKDLGSRNGTLVNGVKISGETELTSGDEVTVGPLKFLITISTGISNVKKPEVKSVAEAVVRASQTPSGTIDDDDITKWLLSPASALSETQTIRLDDTNAIQKMKEAAEALAVDSETAAKAMEAAEADEPAKEADEKGKPGKLKFPTKPAAKDSREAAVEALRAWSRRR
jgi:pSer/pThr/pTyr-binding forkhead associated (FHA) protein